MRRIIVLLAAVAGMAGGAGAQTFPTKDYFHGVFQKPAPPVQLPGPEGLRDRVTDGKLRLSLADVVQLTLANNTDVRLNELQYESAKYAIGRAYLPFDPVFASNFRTTRSTSPSTSQLAGATTLSNLSQSSTSSFTKMFLTGTQTSISFTAGKFASNSSFSTFNPSISSSLDFSFTQPLWRNFGLEVNRASIVIARRNLKQSRATFEAQVTDAIARATDQYWAVVGARDNLNVLRKSLELAETTYKLDKRKLELGALPPLDIYRSESQVATRRVQVISAEYAVKQVEDELRRTIGADLDPYFRALDLDLVEKAEATGELYTMDAQEAIGRALQHRPEIEALRQQLANDDTDIALAHNGLKPDLNLTGFYSTGGVGGNAIDNSTVPPTITPGGLHDSLTQLGSFDFPTYGFSLQLRLPIKNRSAQADLGNAMLSKQRSLYVLRQREQAIALDARNAVHQLEESKLSMEASRIARDVSQKNLEAEQRKYELGVQTIFFVLDAQTQLAQAEQGLLVAQIRYQRAVTAVHRATAGLLDRHKVKIAQ